MTSALIDSMDENTAPEVPYVYLYSTGMLHDALPVRVVSSCNLDIYTFPFDIQNCTLTFNSYIHQSESSPHIFLFRCETFHSRAETPHTHTHLRFTFLLPVRDIKVIQERTAEQITQTSKKVITTMGEWELLDISSHKPETDLSDDKYIDHLDFHVGWGEKILMAENVYIFQPSGLTLRD